MIGIIRREQWTRYKKAYVEFGFILGALSLGLQLYTALILTLTSVPKFDIIIILIVGGALMGISFVFFGRWQYFNKRSFYKKDAEIEALNNPYSQAVNIMLAKIADATGVDSSEFKRKWIKQQEIEI